VYPRFRGGPRPASGRPGARFAATGAAPAPSQVMSGQRGGVPGKQAGDRAEGVVDLCKPDLLR